MSGPIIAFAEQRAGALKKTALEVVSAAADLAGRLNTSVIAVVIAHEVVTGVEALGTYGAAEVLLCGGEAFKGYAPGAFARALRDIAEEKGAAALLLPASAMGKDLAPRLSALLHVPCASDCVALTAQDGAIEAKRPVYAGKAYWTVRSSANRFLATLRPNVFTPRKADAGPAPVTNWSPKSSSAPRVHLKEVIEPEGGRKIELTEADIIVSGGRGMKGPENYNIIEDLAAALGGAVGASRAAVDAGWRPHSDQVGQTGKTVSPTLYIAAGISGAIQHLAGMSSSRVIVAINKDPEAPIFKLANYGIVGDLFEIVPALTAAVQKAKSHS